MFAVRRNSLRATLLLRERWDAGGLCGGCQNVPCWWEIIIKSIKSTGGEDENAACRVHLKTSAVSCENWFRDALVFRSWSASFCSFSPLLLLSESVSAFGSQRGHWMGNWHGVTPAMTLPLWVQIDHAVLFIIVKSKKTLKVWKESWNEGKLKVLKP